MNRSSTIRKPSILRSKSKQVANSFDALDENEQYRAKEEKQSTRAKLSQTAIRVTQPVRQTASNMATRGRQSVDAVKRRSRQGVDIVKSKSSRGIESIRVRSKSIPRVRKSTFQVSSVMRDKPMPVSVFGRKKEKKEKCQEDWRNTKNVNVVEKSPDKKKKDGNHCHEDSGEFKRSRSTGSHRSGRDHHVEFDDSY